MTTIGNHHDRKLAPVHPGRTLRETLEEFGISARQFALHVGTTPRRLSLVLRACGGER